MYGDDSFGMNGARQDAYAAFNEAVAVATPGANGVMYLPWLRG